MADMAEKAWYRKYRPYTMKDYCGERIKQVVQNRFTSEKNRPNVLMIYGTKGCGKTTFARIISKYYLCESPVNGEPCEECEICKSINEILIDGEPGVECPGVTEVDTTTYNGKNDVQQIIEDAEIAPIYTKYKIIIFDECHEMSKAAQNSLLKIIEDIPPHLVVIFATTDPDKVIGTIHSRCQLKLEARKQSVEDMKDRLLEIANLEGLTTSEDALRLIAKKGDRIPRECINLLENVAKNYNNNVLLENVIESTGDVASEIYMEFFRASNTSLMRVLQFNRTLKEKRISAHDFMSGIMRFSIDAMYIKHGIALEDYTPEYVKQIKELYNTYTSGDFDMLLQILEYASNSLGKDDAKNEVILITTAMRIGKIKLLADGLRHEQLEASKENNESIVSYSKRTKQMINPDSVKQVITPDSLSKISIGLKEVTDIKDKLLSSASLSVAPEVSLVPDDTLRKEDKEDDTYLSEDELLKMLNDNE